MILSALLALSQPAAALEVKWWGVGPTVGTMAIPGRYPFAFPANAKGVDEEGNEYKGDPLVNKVRGDISFGARGVLYPTARSRLGARGLIGLGIGDVWTSGQLTLEYDAAVINEDGFQLLLGAGVGAGTERFGGGTAEAPDGYLVANYFPLRAQVSTLLRDKVRAYEVNLYGTWHIVADQTYFADKTVEDGITGADVGGIPGAVYGGLGIEATVFFGDFRSGKASGSGDGGGDSGGGRKRGQ
jgi:hypothetical protein